MPDIRYEKDGHVAAITLDRPGSGNALTYKLMTEDLPSAWQRARDDRDVRAIVFTAAGERHFCTGMDMRDPGLQAAREDAPDAATMPLRMTARQNDVWKPVVTAVNGHCIGGGLMFAGDSDVVIASENARFSNTGVSIGVIAPVGPVVMARKMSFEAVMRMMVTGRHEYIDAQRAFQLGLVSEVTPPDKLLSAAMDVARKIASNSPAAVQETVRLMWETLEMPLGEALDSAMRRAGSLRGHPDSIEGPRAWAEKREPNWSS